MEQKPLSETCYLSEKLTDNLDRVKNKLGSPNDLMIREFEIMQNPPVACAALAIDGLTNSAVADEFILKIMMIDIPLLAESSEPQTDDKLLSHLFTQRISMIDAKVGKNEEDLYQNLLGGHIIVTIDGYCEFLMFDCKQYPTRAIGEPSTDKTIRGPKESFIENFRTNTALIRRRIKDERLRFESFVIGEVTRTDIAICYINGIVNPEDVETARQRINDIDIDGITDASELMQYIEDEYTTVFPRLITTERPDKVTAELLEGRLGIIVDGSPLVILGPITLPGLLQAEDDYYSRPIIGSLQRILRFIAFWVIALVPGMYIALSTFHQEMIPTQLLILLINQRSTNPFPTVVETLIVLFLFEIIREASVRKPTVIGDSMTIVGSLIIGQTLVSAGLVSYMVIIIAALTSVSSFVLSATRLNNATRILTYVFIILGTFFGLYGITLGVLTLIIHLCSLTSFNRAYMAPIAPYNLHDQEDELVRFSLKWMKKRPKMLKTKNVTRAKKIK